MKADTRAWIVNRLQTITNRVENPQRIPDGYVLVSHEALAELVEDAVGDDEPLDPDEMRAANLTTAMGLNEDVSPLLHHVGDVRRKLMDEHGFTEETAEHMAMIVFSQVIGAMVED